MSATPMPDGPRPAPSRADGSVPSDILVRVAAAGDAAGLARALRGLRHREARLRRGPELTYRQIAARTGWSVSAVGSYFSGARVPRPGRLHGLLDLLGADETERAAFDTARARVSPSGPRRSRRRSARPVLTAGRYPTGGLGARYRPGVQSADDVPRTLPARVRGFVGRAAELAVLDRLLDRDVGASGPGRIATVTGMGGVGKTALAVHWGRRAATAFVDGQLYVDLNGYSAHPPRAAGDALGVLLSALGVDDADLPPTIDERAELYQRLLRGRVFLVVLDNAVNAEQVRPLLPPPSCAVLVTGRDRRLGTDIDAAHRIALDPMPAADSVALIRLLIGERADQDLAAAHALARRCGHLPLALRVAAEQITDRASPALADLVADVDGRGANLEPFEVAGDPRADVRTVLSWSLRWIPDSSAQLFRLLGLAPRTAIDRDELAVLAGVAPGWVEELLAPLCEGNLVRSDGADRFFMHDLLFAYARELCANQLPAEERYAAIERLSAATR